MVFRQYDPVEITRTPTKEVQAITIFLSEYLYTLAGKNSESLTFLIPRFNGALPVLKTFSNFVHALKSMVERALIHSKFPKKLNAHSN